MTVTLINDGRDIWLIQSITIIYSYTRDSDSLNIFINYVMRLYVKIYFVEHQYNILVVVRYEFLHSYCAMVRIDRIIIQIVYRAILSLLIGDVLSFRSISTIIKDY